MPETIRLTRDIPIVADVDVLVAGGGIAGVTAALAAAREGARVVLVDRFGYLGGNMGPGMFSGGVVHLALKYPLAMLDRIKGIPGEIVNRAEGFSGAQLGRNYLKDHQSVSYVLFKMMEENGVELMLNTYAADPIIKDGAVTGLVVQNKSGTQAVRAKVTVDGTADADVAFRAGCPTAGGEKYVHPGMWFAIGNVDGDRYGAWLAENEPQPENVDWCRDTAKQLGASIPERNLAFCDLYRRAWFLGEYMFVKAIENVGAVWPDHGIAHEAVDGIVSAQLGVHGPDVQSGDAAMMTKIEIACRVYIFETAQFMRRHVPGFENSYLYNVSPYFHTRGGRAILGEYVMTDEDFAAGRRFDDTIFENYAHERTPAVEGGCDFPYRQLIPKKIEGLICAGKSAILQPPTNRTRWKCFLMGQAAGVAAAMAARKGEPPGKIDVKELQRKLYFKYHTSLGPPERLVELGLESPDAAVVRYPLPTPLKKERKKSPQRPKPKTGYRLGKEWRARPAEGGERTT